MKDIWLSEKFEKVGSCFRRISKIELSDYDLEFFKQAQKGNFSQDELESIQEIDNLFLKYKYGKL